LKDKLYDTIMEVFLNKIKADKWPNPLAFTYSKATASS
jgi:hypothetical protein